MPEVVRFVFSPLMRPYRGAAVDATAERGCDGWRIRYCRIRSRLFGWRAHDTAKRVGVPSA